MTSSTVEPDFKGSGASAQAGYYGSFFKNNVPFMSWQNWASGRAGTATVNTISSAPSNDFSQVSATAWSNFTPATKLVANGSYGARHTERPVHHERDDAGRAGDLAERARGEHGRSTRS